jgi:hypothetical protein
MADIMTEMTRAAAVRAAVTRIANQTGNRELLAQARRGPRAASRRF